MYCAEGVDNDGPVQQLFIENIQQSESETHVISEGILKNVIRVSLEGKLTDGNGTRNKKVKLIPYYAWNNRGDVSMIVWFPTKPYMIQFND